MKTVILTEKPSVARDFAVAMGMKQQAASKGVIEDDNYIITWAFGHLMGLFDPEEYDIKWKRWSIDLLPILPEEFKYKPLEKTGSQLEIIKQVIKRKDYDKLIIATDAGREGEVIARTILMSTSLKNYSKVYRFWTSQALTPDVVKDAMANLEKASAYERLWNAGQSRQIADWLIGMNVSRAATVKLDDLFSVGRVQTAVLALIVDRKRERERFKPEPYWLLKVLFFNKKGTWWGSWFKEEQSRFLKEEDAKQVLALIENQIGVVISVKTQNKKEPPPPLYSLTDLQRDANKKFGFSAQYTLDTAQALYETKKCLSYPRTDSKVLGSKNVDLAKNIVERLSRVYPNIFLGVKKESIDISNKRVFNDAKLTDHHALIPLAELPKGSSEDENRIYDLVLRSFAAAFHPDCEFKQTDIITGVKSETFRTKGKIITNAGWRVLYGVEAKEEAAPDDEDSQDNLPALKKDDPANINKHYLIKRMTTPPPEYTEALLLKDMTNPARYVAEDKLKKIYRGDVGLGTQATRAQIIETLLKRNYVIRDKRHLLATDKGCLLIDKLRNFQTAKLLTSPEETARWESQLDSIAQGKGKESDFINHIKDFVVKTIQEFKTTMQTTTIKVFGKCPACGGNIIEGKRGFGCANWKPENGACKFVIWKDIEQRTVTPSMIKQLLEQKRTEPIQGLGYLELVKENDDWKVKVINSMDSRAEKSFAQSNATNDQPPLPDESYINSSYLSSPESAPYPTEPMQNTGLPPYTVSPYSESRSQNDSKVVGSCPACGAEIVETQKAYGCSKWRDKDGGCKFTIWKIIAKKEISRETAKQLLANGITDQLDGFISKAGKPFSAKLKVGYEQQGKLGITFEFEKFKS